MTSPPVMMDISLTNFTNNSPNIVAKNGVIEWLAFLLCILETLGSNLDQETG
jgi:hypothetical protein